MAKIYKDPSGLGLMEVVVAVGVAALLFVALMAMNNVVFKSQKTAQADAEWLTMLSSIQTILGNDPACAQAFRSAPTTVLVTSGALPYRNPPVVPTAPPRPGVGVTGEIPGLQGIYLGDPAAGGATPVAVLNSTIGNDLTVTDLRLLPAGYASTLVQLFDPKSGKFIPYNRTLLRLYFQVRKAMPTQIKNGLPATSYGSQTLDNFTNMPLLALYTDPASGAIQHCSNPGSPDGTCALLHGAFDPKTGQCQNGSQVQIPLGTLALYNTALNKLVSGAGCPTAISFSTYMMALNLGCSRYCGSGCPVGVSTCSPSSSTQGLGFAGGTASDCSGTHALSMVLCNCNN